MSPEQVYAQWVREQGWHRKLVRQRARLGRGGNYVLAHESGESLRVEQDTVEGPVER